MYIAHVFVFVLFCSIQRMLLHTACYVYTKYTAGELCNVYLNLKYTAAIKLRKNTSIHFISVAKCIKRVICHNRQITIETNQVFSLHHPSGKTFLVRTQKKY